MTVLRELFDSRAIEVGLGEARGPRRFLVTGTPDVAVRDPDLPPYGDPFPGHEMARAVRRKPVRLTEEHSIVEVAYEQTAGGGTATQEHRVGDWEDESDFMATSGTEYIDLDDKPMGPSGEGVSVYQPHGGYILHQWEGKLRYAAWYAAEAHMNSDTWLGFQKETWLFIGARVTPERAGLWKVSYTFEYSDKGHQPQWFEVDKRTNLPVGGKQEGRAYETTSFSSLTGQPDPIRRSKKRFSQLFEMVRWGALTP